MMGEEYTADAAGPTFDPELLLQARRNGADTSEVLTRKWALSGPPLPGVMEAFGSALAAFAESDA